MNIGNIKRCVMIASTAMCAASLSALEIEDALQQTAEQFSSSINKGSTIAIVGISSPTVELSDFMLEELTLCFVQAKTLTVANRANLDASKSEMKFQLSGEVSESSMQQIGAKVGANFVVHGNFKPLGKKYTLTMQALDVTTGAVADMCRFSIDQNDTTKSLLQGTPSDGNSAAASKPASSSSAPARSGKSQSKYSGDIQLMNGARIIQGDYVGFSSTFRNFNLFNLNDIFSIGFFESLSGAAPITGTGCSFAIGPAAGLNLFDIVKFQIGFGLSAGVDFGFLSTDKLDNSFVFGYGLGPSFHAAVKFTPARVCSFFISYQYEQKDGRTKHTEIKVSAMDISAGISFNLGRRH